THRVVARRPVRARVHEPVDAVTRNHRRVLDTGALPRRARGEEMLWIAGERQTVGRERGTEQLLRACTVGFPVQERGATEHRDRRIDRPIAAGLVAYERTVPGG